MALAQTPEASTRTSTASSAAQSSSDTLVQPPKLTRFVEAAYPADALSEGREAQVLLRVTVDAQGGVSDAEVVEPAGHGFDEAALAAVKQFAFSPATRGGVPFPARILYTYSFSRPPPPPEGSVRGRVSMPGPEGGPAVGVEVTISAQEGPPRMARTDAEGFFEFEGLPVGAYLLKVGASGIGQASLPIAVAAGETAEPAIRLIEASAAQPLNVTVQGKSAAERLRQSAQAVEVIETEEAKKQTADLGEVLARTKGIGVRRGGGLGSETRFSLNGLTDDQIRFFLDGIPLELSGYTFGIANVPIDLIERVEVYRGVVPIQFGADALGGGVNLVTSDDFEGTHGSLSYLAGDFGTHRLAASARTLHDDSGFFVRASGFFDATDNDYDIDVEVPNDVGRLSPANVYRFHDAYQATGGNVQFGFVDRPWARRLMVRGFVTDFRNELQNNIVMTVPYGEVEFGELTAGATIRYEHAFAEAFTVEVVGGYSYSATDFLDVGDCVYSWFGQCLRERAVPGEISSDPTDQTLWQHGIYGRFNLGWQLHTDHAVRLSISPTFTTQTGDERIQSDPNARDPLTADRDLITLVSGIEYEADLFRDQLENILFAKSYLQIVNSEEPLPGGVFREQDRDSHRFGVGNAIRYRFVDEFYVKASYEFATRLPRPEEVFGDGVLIAPNLELEPEVSHNVNVGFTLDIKGTGWGDWRGEVNGFLREAEQLIVLLGNDQFFTFQNVFGARSVGVEAQAGWTSPGEYLLIDANTTYLDFRNTSGEGTFGDFEGDRIPNRPYFFANGTARLQVQNVMADEDELAFSWNTRFVEEFFRGWESVGRREFKQTVDTQLIHSAAIIYRVSNSLGELTFAGEWQNLTDEPAFDFFGVQRPGRAFFFKTTAAF